MKTNTQLLGITRRYGKQFRVGALLVACLLPWYFAGALATEAPEAPEGQPEASDVQVFKLREPEKNGDNAAIFVTFSDKQRAGDTHTFVLNDKKFILNDKGIAPDSTAGDGVFSGFASITDKDYLSDVATYKKRLEKLKSKPRVVKFSGRTAIEYVDFDIEKVHESELLQPLLAKNNNLLPLDRAAILPQTLAPTFDNSKVLAITDLSVVADQSRTFDPCNLNGAGTGSVNGAWSFKILMANMANTPVTGVSTQQFIHNWLLGWMSNQTVNGFTINARPSIKAFFPGWDGVNAKTLNVERLPFRLLAITNRIDLAKVSTYGGASGEIRFVFGLESGVGATACTSPSPSPMTAIFEYRDNTNGRCSTLKSLANQWIALNNLTFPSAQYNTALQQITDTVTAANVMPGRPNNSALSQLRTNEIALAGPWQLREFVINATSHSLVSDTVKQTPDESFMGSTTLGAFANANLSGSSNLLCDTAQVPLIFLGKPFRGAKADTSPGKIWTLPPSGVTPPPAWPSCNASSSQATLAPTPQNVLSEIRQHISLNTCDDCHAGETNTTFTHVSWSNIGAQAQLSGFMTGITVADPLGSGIIRKYNDLARRAQILQDISTKSCTSLVNPAASFFAEQQKMLFVH